MKFSRRQALALVAAASLSGVLQLAQAADAPQVLLKTNTVSYTHLTLPTTPYV